LKAWKKAATSEAIKDEIMAGLRKQLQIWGILDPLTMRYVPHASTYLNGRRWEDESTTSRHSVESRHIACDKCGDSGLMQTWGGANGDYPAGIRRCSCARGSLPGLVIPQADANDPAPL
jgi:hypothetical protein